MWTIPGAPERKFHQPESGTLKVTGAGTLASTDLETEAGAVLETDGGALAADADVDNEGTLRIVGGDESISTINGAGNLELNAGGQLTLTGGTSTIDGVISGSGTLVLDDAADSATDNTYLTLTGDSSGFTGETEVTDGTLEPTRFQLGEMDANSMKLMGTIPVSAARPVEFGYDAVRPQPAAGAAVRT